MRLRNLFLAVLLCILVPWTAYSAILFDTSTDRVFIADGSALTLPDADWTIAWWVKMTSTAMDGATTRKALTWNYSQSGTGYFDCYIHTSGSTAPYDVSFDLNDNDGTAVTMTSTSNPFQSNTDWTLILLERSGDTISVWVNNVQIASSTNASFDALDVAFPLYIASRDTHDRLFDGSAAALGKWDRVLNTAEKTALNAGFAPDCFPQSLVLYSPLIRDYNEIRAGLGVTESGTTVVAHPRLYSCN